MRLNISIYDSKSLHINVIKSRSFSSNFRIETIAWLLNFPDEIKRTDVTPQNMACSGPEVLLKKNKYKIKYYLYFYCADVLNFV